MIKKTKIVATIGPSSWDKTTLTAMIANGMNVARINASFADHAEIKRVTNAIRSISQDIAIMLDTKGHKLRVSEFKEDITLTTGQSFSFFTEDNKDKIRLITESDIRLEEQIPINSNILIDDGLIQLKVTNIHEQELICKVVQGGILKTGKGVNIPKASLKFTKLTEKDHADIKLAKELSIDFIAASFIRNTEDVQRIQKLIRDSDIKLIAKIEDGEGVDNFDAILEQVYGIMVARGDLGTETKLEKVPILQKQFIRKCNALGKPVIVATQMLESMTENPKPTRAEVNDVANAIYDGADAIMLSAETSSGKYPTEAVLMMTKIAQETEKTVAPIRQQYTKLCKSTTNAMAEAVFASCTDLRIDKIIVVTATGITARAIARFRPKQPIFALTTSKSAQRSLILSRGITPTTTEICPPDRDKCIQLLLKTAKAQGYVTDSDLVVVITGGNIMQQGETNMLEINKVSQIIGA